MSRKRICLAFIVCMIAELIGGIGANQLLMGVPAFAEKAAYHEKIILAEDFGLVNKDPQVCGKDFRTPKNRPALILYDQENQKETILELPPGWMSIMGLLGWLSPSIHKYNNVFIHSGLSAALGHET